MAIFSLHLMHLSFPLRSRCLSQKTSQITGSTMRIHLASVLCKVTCHKLHNSPSTLNLQALYPAPFTNFTTLSRTTLTQWDPIPTAPLSRTNLASSTTKVAASEVKTIHELTSVPSDGFFPRVITLHQVSGTSSSSSITGTPGDAGKETVLLLSTKADKRLKLQNLASYILVAHPQDLRRPKWSVIHTFFFFSFGWRLSRTRLHRAGLPMLIQVVSHCVTRSLHALCKQQVALADWKCPNSSCYIGLMVVRALPLNLMYTSTDLEFSE